MRTRRLSAVVVAATLAAGLLTGCAGGDPESACATTPERVVKCPVEDRADAPTVAGETLEGQAFDLAQHRGKVVVVNFWGSWCAPCRAEIEHLQEVYEQTRDDGVEFLGINIRDDRDKARAFQRGRVTYPSLFDPESRLALAFDLPPKATPATFVLDRDGRIAALAHVPVRAEVLRPVVAEVAAESRSG